MWASADTFLGGIMMILLGELDLHKLPSKLDMGCLCIEVL